jgi:alkylated DNA repair dioxygenase AlkB
MKKQKVDLDKTYKQLLQTTNSKPPAKVKGGYLSQAEATALFYSLSGIQWDILYNRYGLAILRRTKTYYEGDLQAATNYMNEYGDKGAKPIPFTQAPQELQDLRKRLQRDYPKLPLSVCYINYYYSGKATIGWHQDREEHHCLYPMLMATVYGQGKGVTRNFCVLQMNGSKGVAAWGVSTNHGDLIETPIGFHDNYFHSVRKERAFTLPRVSLTFRNVDLSPNGKWFWHGLKPQVWDCHAKKAYPPDAVYVGCTTRDRRGKVIRQGTIFGNGKNPLRSHRPWIAHTETDFRAYAIKTMQDPAFAKQVAALQGKHLLCWCIQSGPKRHKFCHARVWLELANPQMQEKWDDPPKGIYFPNFLTPEETHAIYDVYKKLGFESQGHAFVRFPDYSNVVTPRMKKQGMVKGPISAAPAEVKALIAKLSKKFKRNINYISTIGYENEDANMFYHQHSEDKGHDTPVWIISTGAPRTFGLREKGKPKTEIRFPVEPGSLLVLPNSYNETHEHAVLKDKTPRAMRIAPNMKAMDEKYYGGKSAKKGGKVA